MAKNEVIVQVHEVSAQEIADMYQEKCAEVDSLLEKLAAMTKRRDEWERIANGYQFQRKMVPETGGYVCDANGVCDTNTIGTMRDMYYNHAEAMSAIASLLRSHEALRALFAERDALKAPIPPTAKANEPEAIADIRAAFTLGRTYLYTQTGDIVCAIAELLDAYDAAVRDARIVYAARRDGCALVPVSHELLSAEWSHEPMHVMLEKNDDGTHTLKIKMSRELSQLRTRLDDAEKLTDEFERLVDLVIAAMDKTIKTNRVDLAGLVAIGVASQRIKDLRPPTRQTEGGEG